MGSHVSLEPIHSQLKLYGIDPGIGHGKPGVGDMLISNVEGDGVLLADEEMKAQGGMSYKVDGRGVERYLRAREQHSSPQLKIRHGSRRAREVPFQIHGVEPCAIGILRRSGLQDVINRHHIGGPFKISSQEASAVIVSKDFTEPNAGIDGLRVLGPAGDAEAAAGPHADVPGLAVKWLR